LPIIQSQLALLLFFKVTKHEVQPIKDVAPAPNDQRPSDPHDSKPDDDGVASDEEEAEEVEEEDGSLYETETETETTETETDEDDAGKSSR